MLVNSLRVLGVGAGLRIGGYSISRQFDTDSKLGHLFLTTVAASMLVRYSLNGVLPDLIGRFKWIENAALPLGCLLGVGALKDCHGRIDRIDEMSSKPVYSPGGLQQGMLCFGVFLFTGALVSHGIRHQFPHLLEVLPRHLSIGLIGGYMVGRGLLHVASGSGERGKVKGGANRCAALVGRVICFGAAIIATDYFSASLHHGLKLLSTGSLPA